MNDADREVVCELAIQEFRDARESGAVFFNLGKLAKSDGDDKMALEHYKKSLDALRTLENPPDGSIEALTQLVAECAVAS